MSFDKQYPNRKDWRKPFYRKAERCSVSCRSNGGCPWCERSRLHSSEVRKESAESEIRDFKVDSENDR